MLQKENHNSVINKKGKYFLLLLLPFLGYGLYQLLQSNRNEIVPANRPEIVEKQQLDTKRNREAVLDATPKGSQSSNLETPTDLNANAGTFTDVRDGQAYQWVRLKDGKRWMAKNLNYQMPNTWCYEDNQESCKQYGRLYTWQAANDACPNGWRLPTDDEWWKMASYYGKAYNAYQGQEKVEGKDDGEVAYKALVQGGETGFIALFGGSHSSSEGFNYLGDLGCYWSSSENSESNALGYYFYIHSRALARDSYHKTLGFSCRCLQD